MVTSIVLAGAGFYLGGSTDPQLSVLGYLGVWFGGILAPLFFFRNAFPRSIPTSFQANADGLTVDAYGVVSSEDILEAKVVPRNGPDAVVELALRGRRSLTLRAEKQHAHALVAVLGARRTRFRLVVPFVMRLLGSWCVFAFAGMVLFNPIYELLPFLAATLFYALVVSWPLGFVRGRLVVGADGFTIRWLWHERFVAFAEVASVRGRSPVIGSAEDTVIEMKSGAKTRLRTVEAPNTDDERGAEARAMLTHLVAAFEQSRRLADAAVDVPALVQRGERSARDWLSGIDALVRGGGSRYRVAALSADMLVELANDPGAKADARAGAAAALVRMGDDALRSRVRISAEACAAPELRETLLALCEARDDEAAEAALDSLRHWPRDAS